MSDHTYILAFSLIMLHTDAFNKSNKHKMTKANYIKNTRLPGVASEVLDVSRRFIISKSVCDAICYGSASTIT
jgi:Sec7 domain